MVWLVRAGRCFVVVAAAAPAVPSPVFAFSLEQKANRRSHEFYVSKNLLCKTAKENSSKD